MFSIFSKKKEHEKILQGIESDKNTSFKIVVFKQALHDYIAQCRNGGIPDAVRNQTIKQLCSVLPCSIYHVGDLMIEVTDRRDGMNRVVVK